MNYKKNIFLIIIIFIVGIQTLLFINNSQKSSFRYLIWNIQSVSIGKLITISFISGISVSTLLNIILMNNNNIYINKSEEIKDEEKIDFDNEPLKDKDVNKFTTDIPPQRDVRDTQPTISVNYRVIKDNSMNEYEYEYEKRSKNYSSNKNDDDWNNIESEW